MLRHVLAASAGVYLVVGVSSCIRYVMRHELPSSTMHAARKRPCDITREYDCIRYSTLGQLFSRFRQPYLLRPSGFRHVSVQQDIFTRVSHIDANDAPSLFAHHVQPRMRHNTSSHTSVEVKLQRQWGVWRARFDFECIPRSARASVLSRKTLRSLKRRSAGAYEPVKNSASESRSQALLRRSLLLLPGHTKPMLHLGENGSASSAPYKALSDLHTDLKAFPNVQFFRVEVICTEIRWL